MQLRGRGGIISFVVSEEFPGSVNGGSKRCDFQIVCVGKEIGTVLFSVICFKVFRFWFSCSLRSLIRGLCLFSIDLAEMVSLRIWISARRIFAWKVGCVCLCPGGYVGVAEGGWRDCV